MNFVLAIALPVFAIIATGYLIGRSQYISPSDSQALNRFIFRIAMPVALFGLTSRTIPPNMEDLPYAVSYLFASSTVLISAYFIARKFLHLPKPDAGVHAFAATLGNAVFLGLPIAQSVPGWGRPFVVLMLVEGFVIISLASILIAAEVDESNHQVRTSVLTILFRPLQNPLVVGSASGFLYAMLGLPLPQLLASYLDIFGKAAGPTALFSLGLFLSNRSFSEQKITPAIGTIIVFKMIALPVLLFIGLTLFGVKDPTVLGACALFSLVPSGIGVFIQASARGRYVVEAATAIAVTTIISVVTVFGALYWFAPATAP